MIHSARKKYNGKINQTKRATGSLNYGNNLSCERRNNSNLASEIRIKSIGEATGRADCDIKSSQKGVIKVIRSCRRIPDNNLKGNRWVKLIESDVSKIYSVRKLIFGLLIIMFLLLMTFNVSALGITPGRSTFEYAPGEERTVEFSVINSESKDISVVVLVQGELNQSISVSEVAFEMGSDESSRSLQYTIIMPPGLTPGLHQVEVVAIQLPSKSESSEAFVGSAIGVATQVHVNVPFPGKYAEASLNVFGPDDSGEMIFAIPVTSRGDLTLVRVRATIDIFSSLNEKIITLGTNEIEIGSGERKEIIAKWDTRDIPPGNYRAVASVIYDEDVTTVEKGFTVGTRLLELQQIEVNDFSLGEIAKFELLVENKWSEKIIGAYTQMQIFNNNGEIMADFKSATYDIDPLTKALMVAFWDTEGVSKGTYDSSVFLRYGDQSVQEDLELEVKDNEINVVGVGYVISTDTSGGGGNSLTIILITAIVVLVLINLLWFLILRKKLKKK